jgi:hypothetical protein
MRQLLLSKTQAGSIRRLQTDLARVDEGYWRLAELDRAELLPSDLSRAIQVLVGAVKPVAITPNGTLPSALEQYSNTLVILSYPNLKNLR